MTSIQFYPIDVTYKIVKDSPVIYIFGKTVEGSQICVTDKSFKPYFWVELKDAAQLENAKTDFLSLQIEGVEVTHIEIHKKKMFGRDKFLLKVFTKIPAQIPIAAKYFSALEPVKSVYEFDIKFALRYLIDNKLTPMRLTTAIGKQVKRKIKVPCFEAESIMQESDGYLTGLKVLALDIETYNPSGKIFAPEKDPIIILGLYGADFKKVITWKRFRTELDYVEFADSERQMLEMFKSAITEYKPDVIVGYNSDSFDLPYIKTRADIHSIKLDLGLENSELDVDKSGARIIGIPHIDVLNFVRRIMGRTLQSDFFTLNDIAEELLGDRKDDVEIAEMLKAWENNEDMDVFCKYNLKDSELAYRLFIKIFPNMLELMKIVGLPLFNLSRASHSQLVESYILKQTAYHDEIAPNRPTYHEKETRLQSTYQGGSVFEPKPGLYSDIAVVDFRSFWPSLIVSHNIGPGTIDCVCCPKSKNTIAINSETYRFCEKQRGFIPEILKELIVARSKVKQQLKTSKKDVLLSARSQALKDLSNAFYGYLGFSSARWYNVQCAKSITAFGRRYIQEVMDKASAAGFGIIYSDTDSVFLAMNKKSQDDVKQFVASVNKALCEQMELEFEEYYPAGLFVSTKSTGSGAKKRYALLNKNGELKIKGFESVRRNSSPIAKETQREVLRLVLADKEPKKALDYLKTVLDELRSKGVPVEKLVLSTLLQKPAGDYGSQAPHVVVAKELMRRGYDVEPGTIIRFVICRGKGRIGERAKLPQDVTADDYDPEYYIENQVLPAVQKIFEALGYNLEQILTEKSQSSLSKFL